ncbi:hypothetical protein [Candidatus Cardinium hertigii]|uniref:hypothetical protein n=1 Tax=Candidatus Cardinium hertigii TaxID=247481 RepID=UPI003D7EB7FC
MISKAKVCRSKKSIIVPVFKALLCGAIFFIQSCSSTISKSRFDKITSAILESDRKKPTNGIFPGQLHRNISELQIKGYVGNPQENDHINFKSNLMFILYHCIDFKQQASKYIPRLGTFQPLNRHNMIQKIVRFFGNNGDNVNRRAMGLMYSAVPVTQNNQTVGVKFVLNNLLSQDNDPNRVNSINKINNGLSPEIYTSNKTFLVLGNNNVQLFGPIYRLERLEVDHLLRDNIVTIEIPYHIHKEKTNLLDRFLSSSEENIERNSRKHFRKRLQELGLNNQNL